MNVFPAVRQRHLDITIEGGACWPHVRLRRRRGVGYAVDSHFRGPALSSTAPSSVNRTSAAGLAASARP